ncbi:GDSL-type esterase/lipase family protein [Pseudothauera rhizosphaerae]|uniref:SGNH hydrolase-type esterase domain-containing protein n=1 Tax=Pseudothauera rhizosphaerae TaxID=2565932 RepID=A0A4S4A7Y0_9RHOO|nr:GDSL-type esterase/lipase family protein [Pseudothauera rhizosphaerae]THF54671.1 hypothetical protein E6O51_21515 [Pseudothauera rhizosphaerae]
MPHARRISPFLAFALFCLALLGGCADDRPRFAPLPDGASVLVLGDSLVAGTGAPRGQGWPEGLARHTGWNVINAGVPGNTSADARGRLPGLLAEYQPDAVIVAIGGNDFLRQVPAETTRENIRAIVAESRAATGHVALVAIPALSLGAAALGALSDHELYEEIARANGLALVPAAVAETLSDEDYRADRIHANAAGYARIAARVRDALAAQGWMQR